MLTEVLLSVLLVRVVIVTVPAVIGDCISRMAAWPQACNKVAMALRFEPEVTAVLRFKRKAAAVLQVD